MNQLSVKRRKKETKKKWPFIRLIEKRKKFERCVLFRIDLEIDFIRSLFVQTYYVNRR